jgi:type II secretion system protein C
MIALCVALGGSANAHDKDPSAIIRRNVFCSGCTAAESDAPAHSALALELVSTMVCPREPSFTAAVIRERADAVLVRRGDVIAGAQVIAIVRRRVYLRVRDHVEYLELARAPSAPAAEPMRVERALVDGLLRDPAALSAMVRALPSERGFRLYAIRAGSPIARIGLENGDTLRAINGLPLATLDDALEAVRRLRSAIRLTLAIERGGRALELDYTLR